MLETSGIDVTEAIVAGWRTRVALARQHLQWNSPDPALHESSATVARRHATGVSFALAAPFDQLFTATEINEWALCATLHEADPIYWRTVAEALLADYLADADDPADVIPPVLEERAALARFGIRSAAERRDDLRALLLAAKARGLRHVLDDERLTLGAGSGGRSWRLNALPSSDQVPWQALHGIPVATVTGSNGKTTTVRLLAACARAHGWRDGFNCTDGVFIQRAMVASGDYSGPAGTRRVLRDPAVEAAILETARGGILRRGLAIEYANVAIVTNISPDHFGEYGIDDLDGLADVKLSVAHVVGRDGLLVLNADDALLVSKSAILHERLGWRPRIGWFGIDHDGRQLARLRDAGSPCSAVRDGRLVVTHNSAEHDLGAITDMPLTVAGTATYNVANLAGAALGALALRIEPATIAAVFASFGRDPADNAGRLMRFDIRGVHVVLDYAHNPDGLRGVLQVAQRLRSATGRIGMLLGHAGNRLNEDIAELAYVAMEFSPDLVIVKEDEGHLRGREPGEVPAIIRAALLSRGMAESSMPLCPSETYAAEMALEWARPGDSVVLLIHATAARAEVLEMLRSRSAN